MGANFSGQIRPEILSNRKIADFHPKQIDYMKEKFVLMCEDDLTITVEVFSKLIGVDKGEGIRLFEYFDMDSSGRIDSYEFICALALISHATLEEKARSIFKLYDFDDSMILNFDECVVLVRCCLCSLAALCGRKDVPSITEVEEKVTVMYSRHDRDEDGCLTLDEFISMVTKDKEVLSTLKNYDLLKSYDIRENFGFENQFPDCDSDLEKEQKKGIDDVSSDEEIFDPSPSGGVLKFDKVDYLERMRQGIDFAVASYQDQIYEYNIPIKNQTSTLPPWKQYSLPPQKDAQPDPQDGMIPDADLELEYVYGYRCHDTRNNISYTPNGDIVYHAAGLGICLNKKSNSQKFFFDHTDDITCLTSYDSLVATGQVGKNPLISIWDSKSAISRGHIIGPLKEGITHLAFSQDGKKLAAACNDEYNSIAVYDVQKIINSKGDQFVQDSIIAFNRGPQESIFHMCFDVIGNNVALACKNNIYFGQIRQQSIKLKPGKKWPPNCPKQTVLCIAAIENSIVGGTKSGQLVVFKDHDFVMEKQAHKSACSSICLRRNGKGFITGGKDGFIIGWDEQLNITSKIDLSNDLDTTKYKFVSTKITAIAEDQSHTILIGTRGGELIEIKDNKIQVLNKGHFNKSLNGLCQLKKRDEFVTVGEDQLIAIYDMTKRKITNSHKLMYVATCVDCDLSGKRLAIGCNNGYVLIMDISTFMVIKTVKDRDKEITCIKYSQDGKVLSIGSKDCELHNYSVQDNYALKHKLKSHSSPVMFIDFSEESTIIKSVCSKYEIVYSRVDTGKRIKADNHSFQDEQWSTWTVPVGHNVAGIWPACARNQDINSVARSPDKKLLATADDYGMLKLFRFPCSKEYGGFNKYLGHSSKVTNVIFTERGDYLLTTGGQDKSVMQWKVNIVQDQGYEYLEAEDTGQDGKQGRGTLDEEDEIYNHLKLFKDPKNANPQGLPDLGSKNKTFKEDQMHVVKPYIGELKSTVPSNFKPTKNCHEEPNQNLSLYHLFGVKSYGVKNMVKYTGNDKIVFTCAKLGVVMDPTKKIQSFFSQHTDDVVSLCLHPKKKLVATGQITREGKSKMVTIYVWDLETKEIISQLRGFHKYGVNILKFSPDGSKLLSIGKDERNSLAIYDWAHERLICESRVDNASVYDADWKNESDSDFVTVGKRHIKFFETKGTSIKVRKGRWGSNPSEPLLSVVFCFPQNMCMTGGKFGKIYTWQYNTGTCIKVTDAHSASIRVLISHKHMLYSGGDDGVVNMWSYGGTKLQKQGTDGPLLNISKFTQADPAIRSLDIKNGTFLVSTRGGEIIELQVDEEIARSNVVLQGHANGKVFAMATHPMTSRFVSSGQDQTLRVFDASNKIQITCKKSDHVYTALDWSSDGNLIVAATSKGLIVLMDTSLQEVHKLHSSFADNKCLIQVLKISPDNLMVAFGAEGSSDIEVHSIANNKLVSKGIMRGLTSSTTHIDWATESNIIQVNSDAFELKFFSLNHMKFIKSSQTRDVKYNTISCKYGWSTIGIYNDVDNDQVNQTCMAKNQKVLATSQQDGEVRIYRYPSTQANSGYKAYTGHSGTVKNLQFMSNDSYLVSTGSEDGTLMIWKTDFGNFEGLEEDEHFDLNYDGIELADIQCVTPELFYNKYGKNIKNFDQGKEIGSVKGQNQLFEPEQNEAAQQYMAIKPWQATIKPPRKFIKPEIGYDSIPKVKLELHHVFGYHSSNVRNNLKLLPHEQGRKNHILYFTAALGINHNLDSNKQKFFTSHNFEITAMDLSEDKKLVATGERSAYPKIYIWNSQTMIQIGSIEGIISSGVRVLKFSPDATKLLATSCDEVNSLFVFNLSDFSLITKVKGDTNLIFDAIWLSEQVFHTVGVKNFKRWELKDGRLKDKKGLFDKHNKILTCVTKNNGLVVAGTTAGTLQTWRGFKIENEINIAEKSIDCIALSEHYVLVAGSEGIIYILNLNYVEVTKIEVPKLIEESIHTRIRSMDCSVDNKSILIGTQGSDIFRLKTNDAKINKLTRFNYDIIMQGHASTSVKNIDEVWGLACFSDGISFVTVGDDSTLRVWSSETRSLIKAVSLNYGDDGEQLDLDQLTNELPDGARLRSVAISPNDAFIAVGAKDGTLRILNAKDFNLVKHIKDRNKWIQDLKFSPNNLLLAVGCHDNYIDVYMVPDFRRKYALKKHSSFITHMDWSRDSQNLQSNCGAFELLFWDMTQGKQMTTGASTLRDEIWAEQTCVLSWPVQGIWQQGAEGSEINMVARSTDQLFGEYNIVATAEDNKFVNLYKYPCLKKGAGKVVGKGHSSFVTNVKFSKGDQFLYSTGGRDGSVFIWKVTK